MRAFQFQKRVYDNDIVIPRINPFRENLRSRRRRFPKTQYHRIWEYCGEETGIERAQFFREYCIREFGKKSPISMRCTEESY